MDKNYLIKLTNELYRLTLLFPKKEPLRYKMRELAAEILAKSGGGRVSVNPAEVGSPSILAELEVLDGFFEVVKNQNWVKPVEILRIQEEYSRIRAEVKKIPKRVEPAQIENAANGDRRGTDYETRPRNNLERQQKILEILKEKGRAQVWEIQKIFPSLTKRTLRRDFRNLLKNGLIERLGERNETFYQIKPK